jgi:hypothetical protein
MHKNTEMAKQIITHAVAQVPETNTCACTSALAASFITEKSLWPPETIEKLKPIIEKYL